MRRYSALSSHGLGLVVWLLVLPVVAGCLATGGAQDAKVAEAEYGLAADAFHRARYREALAHVRRALDRDETHADAAYLGAMVMLVFCATDESSP